MTEVCWLLGRWPKVEAAFLAQVARGTFELVHLTPADVTRMGELVLQYADFPLGGVDASVIAVAERFGVDRVATLDRRHFSVVKPAHVPRSHSGRSAVQWSRPLTAAPTTTTGTEVCRMAIRIIYLAQLAEGADVPWRRWPTS